MREPAVPRSSCATIKEKNTVARRLTKRVATVVSKVFSLDSSIESSWGPKDIAGWHSLDHLNLILGLEEEFGISLHEDDMVCMNTVKDICKIMEKNIHNKFTE